ncbi:MAG: argininosuccinate lyase [Paramuribaculum sp.]|nr:argininosuccinate lyase [Paramuribaculum sp.]
MKLWSKGLEPDKMIEDFTVGRDRDLDLLLAKYDVQGSKAHIKMLSEIGLLKADEWEKLDRGLDEIAKDIENGKFAIEPGVEDVHSQVEFLLTQKLGDVGKKIHSGRSRNDQVLVDLKLFFRAELKEIAAAVNKLFVTLQKLSEEHKDKLMPGYTHLQIAMPSSFGLWFGAYAEALIDDMQMLLGAYRIADQNPLGSAAGYGSSFPLNRKRTTELLGFSTLHYNVVAAQMSRGKTERAVAMAISSIASTLGRFAMDVCLWNCQNFNFITFPAELTTGSSIMPHKKNPDVFEIMRGKCNILQSLPNEVALLTVNLPLGYNRDLQLLKDLLFPACTELRRCLEICDFMLANIIVRDNLLDDPKYDYLFTVEEVNRLVLEGMPFRDAYRKVGMEVERGEYRPVKSVAHTHEGSIGNLCNAEISFKMQKLLDQLG